MSCVLPVTGGLNFCRFIVEWYMSLIQDCQSSTFICTIFVFFFRQLNPKNNQPWMDIIIPERVDKALSKVSLKRKENQICCTRSKEQFWSGKIWKKYCYIQELYFIVTHSHCIGLPEQYVGQNFINFEIIWCKCNHVM